MNKRFCHQLLMIIVIVGAPAAWAANLVDLGPAGPATWDSNVADDMAAYIVDVSKDGTLAGGTDSSGNPFIWTAANGKVFIGSSRWLVGVDWLITNGVSTNVLAVVNDNSTTTPLYWQGAANGTGGSWTSFPLEDDSSPWVATALGVGSNLHNIPPDPVGDWWAAGYRNLSADPYEYQLRYQNSTASATSIDTPSEGPGHARCFFFAASNEGTFAGRAMYGKTAPNGQRNGEKWYYGIRTGSPGDKAYWCGPPDAGDGTQPSSGAAASIAQAISGDGRILGGLEKGSIAIYHALFWAKHLYVYKLPRILIGGSTYADWMGVRALNRNGTVMGGYYYTDPPTDAGPVEAFIFYLSGYNESPPPDPDSVTGTLLKVGDLLGTYGMDTNGWAFREVTGLSDDGNTLVGYGVTNGVTHAWLAQLPPPILTITNIGLDGSGNVLIDFTSSRIGDHTGSFAAQQSATLVNGSTPFVDFIPGATITGSASSFRATVPQTGDAQFYRIRHL